MTIKVPLNATKADFDLIFKNIEKKNPKKKSKDFIGKIKFNVDSLAFQRDLR
jgi:hypothetical protein